jgi:hypothetical protein
MSTPIDSRKLSLRADGVITSPNYGGFLAGHGCGDKEGAHRGEVHEHTPLTISEGSSAGIRGSELFDLLNNNGRIWFGELEDGGRSRDVQVSAHRASISIAAES